MHFLTLADGSVAAIVAKEARFSLSSRGPCQALQKIITHTHRASVSLVAHHLSVMTPNRRNERFHLPIKPCVTQMFHTSSSEQWSTPSGILVS